MALVARRLGARELSVDTTSEPVDGRGLSPTPIGQDALVLKSEVITTLNEAWEDAKSRFRSRTTKSVDVPPKDMEDFLEKWAAQYEVDNSEKARKKKEVLRTIQNILDGILVVGGIVASSSSMVFGFAGPCFNALSFLLEIHGRIKKVFDTLLELFEEVADFLLRFKVLKRIDDQRGLPSEMITSAGKLLISFVDICGLSIELLQERRIRTSLKAALLNSDSGASDSLAEFRRMAQSLDSMTHAVALEKIYDGNETSRDTYALVRQQSATLSTVAVTLKSLEQTNNDDKTRRVTEKSLALIKENIYTKEEQNIDMSAEILGELLPDTLTVLERDEDFRRWRDVPPRPGRAAFILKGPGGSGKSCALELLKRSLDKRRKTADREDPSTYVAYHKFGSLVSKTANSSMPFALRNIAMQVSQQSTAYASELANILREDKKTKTIISENDIDKLWSMLKLSTFKTNADATMYLMFDNIERETESMIKTLLDLFSGNKAERAKGHDKLSIRAILAVDTEKRQIDSSIASKDMTNATRDLVESYTIKELKRRSIFQSADKRSTRRRKEVIEAVKASGVRAQGPWNFRDVQQRLDRIEAAIKRDASSKEFFDILRNDDRQTRNLKAKEAITTLSNSLTAKEVSQINQLLPWLLYSMYAECLEPEELEAVLYLAHDSDSLQSLENKVKGCFRDLLYANGMFISLDGEKGDVLREIGNRPLDNLTTEKPLINLEISIKNADEAVVRNFVWHLNQEMSEGRFDFASQAGAGNTMITVNRLEGHLCITKMCIKLLNEGWRDETEVLVRYAREFLPRHVVYLKENIRYISMTDQLTISHGLVTFLSEPYYLFEDPDKHFGFGDEWLGDPESIQAVIDWLTETRDKLQTRERLWVKKALSPGYGRLGYLMDIARAVGRKWMLHDKVDAVERWYYDGVRISNSLEVLLFRWLDKFIEKNTLEEEKPESDKVVEGQAVTSTPPGLETVDSAEPEHVSEERNESASTRDDGQAESAPSTQPPPPESQGTRIKTAITWLRENDVFSRETGVSNLNIGYTYLSAGEYADAEHHFKQAMSYDRTKGQGHIGLGRMHYAREEKDKAMEEFQKAVVVFETYEKQNRLLETQTKVLAELYRELAMIYGETEEQNLEKLLECHEKSLKYNDDLVVRWKTLRFLCQSDAKSEGSRALQLLEKWYEHAEKSDHESLSHAMQRSTDEANGHQALGEFVHSIRSSAVRSRIIESLSDAIKLQDASGEIQGKSKLLYLKGIAIVRGSDPRRWPLAVDLWKDALIAGTGGSPTDWAHHYCLYRSAIGILQREFDLVLLEMSADVNDHLSPEEKESVVGRLEHGFSIQLRSLTDMYQSNAKQVINSYLVSMNMILGRVDQARELLIDEMSTACEVLIDDDTDNDYFGVRTLMTVLLNMGDRAGALIAFSLLDRKAAETNPMTSENKAEGSEAVATQISTSHSADCDGCYKTVNSGDTDGLWWCRFCRDFDLCHPCHEQFVRGELILPRCNSDHELIHLYHVDYSAEEKIDNMVKIEWEWKDLGGGKFEREGGRIVPLSEWFEQLRKSWNVPETSTNTRAQK